MKKSKKKLSMPIDEEADYDNNLENFTLEEISALAGEIAKKIKQLREDKNKFN